MDGDAHVIPEDLRYTTDHEWIRTEGDVVRVTSGPLKEFVGVFLASTSPAARVRLLLAAVSSPMRVVVDRDAVVRISSSEM